MPLRPVRRALVLSAVVLALGACGDSTGSDSSRQGALSFSYSGAVSGDFDASGSFRRTTASIEFAAAVVDPEQGMLALIATEPVSGGREDFFAMVAPALERTSTCTASTPPLSCELFAGLLLDADAEAEEYGSSFSGSLGTVTVTELTDRRVRGSFTFALTDDDDLGDSPAAVQVRSGTFDVPVLDPEQLGGSGAFSRAAVRTRVLHRSVR